MNKKSAAENETIDEIVERLVNWKDQVSLHPYLEGVTAAMSAEQQDKLADAIKTKCIFFLGASFEKALFCADLVIELAKLSQNEQHHALGLRLQAQTWMLGKGEYHKALEFYEEASDIYKKNDDLAGQARICATSIWAMANLGQYDEAVKKGEWAADIFKKQEMWQELAIVQNNLAAIHNRSWEYERALQQMDRACITYQEMGAGGEHFLANLEVNRALALFALGRYPESLDAGKKALALAESSHQTVIYAKAQHNMAFTCFFMGQYNRALDLLINARRIHETAGQKNDAALCDLTRVDFLLRLGRFESAHKLLETLVPLLEEYELRLEEAEAVYYQAMAFAGYGDTATAITTLVRARGLFRLQNAPNWAAQADLELAYLHFLSGRMQECYSEAKLCQETFDELGFNYERVQARLLASRASLMSKNLREARDELLEAESISSQEPWPALLSEIHQVKALIAGYLKNPALAIEEAEQSIYLLSQMRRQIMLEYRPSFMQDKNTVFSHLVGLYLETGNPAMALETVERARSQAMIEILAGQLDLSLHAHHPGEQPLVNQIQTLMTEHQKALKRLDYLRMSPDLYERDELIALRPKIQNMEVEITEKWHQLLIHNAEYRLDASLWDVHLEPFIPYLDEDTLLLEFYSDGDQVFAFLVSPHQDPYDAPVRFIRLPARLKQVEGLLSRLRVNLRGVPYLASTHQAGLLDNSQGILENLYRQLLAPCLQNIEEVKRLLIVPYGILHYIPFQALYDGERYLIQKYPLRYLPAASLLPFYQKKHDFSENVLVMGHSFYGKLTHSVAEASQVAKSWGVDPFLEDRARISNLKSSVSSYKLVHLACHGEFHPENPLFSGLALEDGWLTTLDVFNMQFEASLVTLSACQTGQSVIGGGDEVAGLMRAFLSAGATSLVLSLWSVQDEATLQLMSNFYKELAAGTAKDVALQRAQVEMLSTDHDNGKYAHPFYWAPFYLVGDGGIFTNEPKESLKWIAP